MDLALFSLGTQKLLCKMFNLNKSWDILNQIPPNHIMGWDKDHACPPHKHLMSTTQGTSLVTEDLFSVILDSAQMAFQNIQVFNMSLLVI